MAGSFDGTSGILRLQAGEWITRPLGMQSHDLAGRLEPRGDTIVGQVLTSGCASFAVTRR
jgi:hypothetical protein